MNDAVEHKIRNLNNPLVRLMNLTVCVRWTLEIFKCMGKAWVLH